MKDYHLFIVALLSVAACQSAEKTQVPDVGNGVGQSQPDTTTSAFSFEAEPTSYEFGAIGAPPVENVSFTVTNTGTERVSYFMHFEAPDQRERNQFEDEILFDPDYALDPDETITLNVEFRRGSGEGNLVGGVGFFRVWERRTEDELARIELTVADLTEQ